VTTLTTTEVCFKAGITYRRLDYWLHSGVVSTSGDDLPGSGFRREWDPRAPRVLRAIVDTLALLGAGIGNRGDLGIVRSLWETLSVEDEVVIASGSATLIVRLPTEAEMEEMLRHDATV